MDREHVVERVHSPVSSSYEHFFMTDQYQLWPVPLTQRLAPDAILVQTAQSGAVSLIQDDPDSPDANWLTGTSATAAELRVSFPTPDSTLLTGDFKQEFRVRIRPRP